MLSVGCSLSNSMLSMLKVVVHRIFDTAFYKILNAVGDIRCHKVLFYVTNKFL